MLLSLSSFQPKNPTLIWFPPAGGTPHFIAGLKNHLPFDINLFSIHYNHEISTSLSFDFIVHKATHELFSLKTKPIILLGNSLGGYIAYCVTYRLERHFNFKVDKLCMIGVDDLQKVQKRCQEETFISDIIDTALQHLNTPEMADLYEYFKEQLLKDLSLLSSAPALDTFYINSPLYLHLGSLDQFCTPTTAINYWQKKSANFIYRPYIGAHTPDLQTIASLCI